MEKIPKRQPQAFSDPPWSNGTCVPNFIVTYYPPANPNMTDTTTSPIGIATSTEVPLDVSHGEPFLSHFLRFLTDFGPVFCRFLTIFSLFFLRLSLIWNELSLFVVNRR